MAKFAKLSKPDLSEKRVYSNLKKNYAKLSWRAKTAIKGLTIKH